MATSSIFDCDAVGAVDLPRRQLVSYDDDDLFSFGCDASSNHDEIDNAAKSLKIKVTISNTASDDSHRKRKRFIDYDNDNDDCEDSNAPAKRDSYHEPKQKRVSNVQRTIRNVASVASTSRDALANSSAQANEKRAKSTTTEPYTLREQIGEGTYGRVFRGFCTQTKTVIAIKRLKCLLNTPNTVRVAIQANGAQIYLTNFLVFGSIGI